MRIGTRGTIMHLPSAHLKCAMKLQSVYSGLCVQKLYNSVSLDAAEKERSNSISLAFHSLKMPEIY